MIRPEELVRRKREIFAAIDSRSVAEYMYLLAAYPTYADSVEFRTRFKVFYRLNRAFLGHAWTEQYFTLLKNGETSLKHILLCLRQYRNAQGKETYQLSFATKLMHTVDNSRPIYDVFIARALHLPRRRKGIDWCLQTYDQLQDEIRTLLKDPKVRELISEFKTRYNANAVTDQKALDFLLWGFGKQLQTQSFRP